jgi:uncharacterized protein (TIGR03066 family)
MKVLCSTTAVCSLLALAAVAAADADKGLQPKLVGKWQGVKGTVGPADGLELEKFGGFKITQRRANLVGRDGKRLPPTDIIRQVGTYQVEGNKLTLREGPFGKEKETELEVVEVTEDTLILSKGKGQVAEYKRR